MSKAKKATAAVTTVTRVPVTTKSGAESRSITKGAILDGYVKGLGRTASGKPTLDTADEVADRLRGLTAAEVASYTTKTIAKITGEQIDFGAKYAHLNPGQVRMNCGNRLRAALKNASK